MVDVVKQARAAMVRKVKSLAPLASLLPADRFYGPEAPALPVKPWGYVGSPTAVPLLASCMNGKTLSVVVHAFASGPGDDVASAIASDIEKALDKETLWLDDGMATVTWEQTQILRDSGEASAYHAICRFSVDVAVAA